MNKVSRWTIAALVATCILAGCATWRWSGSPPRDERPLGQAPNARDARGELHPRPIETPPASELRLSTVPASPKQRVVVPPTPPEKLKVAAYPADLGPDAVDVSRYPARVQADYQIYARVCSKCHTLARANYAPASQRAFWRLYLTKMRTRAAWKGSRLSRDEVRAILDFLDYDSRLRKRERRQEFEQTIEELERRFNAEMSRRLNLLQKGRPLLDGR